MADKIAKIGKNLVKSVTTGQVSLSFIKCDNAWLWFDGMLLILFMILIIW